VGDQTAHLIRAIGVAAMHLANTINGVRRAALKTAAMDMTRFDQADADIAGDATQYFAPAEDLGDRRLIHAIL